MPSSCHLNGFSIVRCLSTKQYLSCLTDPSNGSLSYGISHVEEGHSKDDLKRMKADYCLRICVRQKETVARPEAEGNGNGRWSSGLEEGGMRAFPNLNIRFAKSHQVKMLLGLALAYGGRHLQPCTIRIQYCYRCRLRGWRASVTNIHGTAGFESCA